MKREIWKPVAGYEGVYEVSNFGNMKSLQRRYASERILRKTKDRKGYEQVNLRKDGKRQCCKVHRLVAEAFIPNPDKLSQVNHKDENKSNNRVENLEWCTAAYNSNYGTRIERIAEKHRKKISQYTIEGQFIKEYNSVSEAAKEMSGTCDFIYKCATKERKTAYGFVWEYSDKGDT